MLDIFRKEKLATVSRLYHCGSKDESEINFESALVVLHIPERAKPTSQDTDFAIGEVNTSREKREETYGEGQTETALAC